MSIFYIMLNKQSVKEMYSAHFKVHNVILRYDYNNFAVLMLKKQFSSLLLSGAAALF